MSLLLDALKKAADEKQKAAQDRPTEETSNPNPVVTEKEPELTLQAGDDEVQSSAETEELTLDVLDAGVTEPEVAKIKADNDLQLEQDNHPDSPEQKSYTVSDEALSMLIYKTNRDFKKSRRLIIAGVMMFSLAILASGAAYYYMDMQ
jgi:hypothetical protein